VRAEVLGLSARFDVQPALRSDGTTGPPLHVSLTLRPCWRKPPEKLDLEFVAEEQNVAYYAVEAS